MTDTQLEQIARALLKRVDEINDIQSSAQMSFTFQVILAALKSVRDVGVQTEQRLDSYQAERHSLEAKIESIREICREHTPKQHDVLKMVQRALKSVRQAAPGAYWLIYYEDREIAPEIFTDEGAARERFASRLANWNCHLFRQEDAADSVHQASAGSPLSSEERLEVLREDGRDMADIAELHDRLSAAIPTKEDAPTT